MNDLEYYNIIKVTNKTKNAAKKRKVKARNVNLMQKLKSTKHTT